MNELIDIKIRGKGRAWRRIKAEGTIVSDHFAVTRTVMPGWPHQEPTFFPKRWTITHRASGFSAATNIMKRVDAILLARELEERGKAVGVDWSLKAENDLKRSGDWLTLGRWWVERRAPFQKEPTYRTSKPKADPVTPVANVG